jgi:hypothetical protein
MARKRNDKKPVEIPTGVKRAVAERKRGADSSALLNDLLEVWGGTRQFSLDVYAEYQKAAAGGMTRQRILEMMQRLVIMNTTHEVNRSTRPADLSDEELEAIAMRLLEKAAKNATPTPAAGQQ